MSSARLARARTGRGTTLAALGGLAALTLAPVLLAAALPTASTAGARSASAPSIIPLEPGLTFTVTSHVGLVTNRGSLPIADTEIIYSVDAADAGGVTLRFLLSAPSGTAAGKLLKSAVKNFVRVVRREDLKSAAREKVLFSGDDPERQPGQTFASTSTAVLAALHGTGSIAFVLGINEPEGDLDALSGMRLAPPPSSAGGGVPPLVVSGMAMMLFSPARHYYRGTLVRVGGDEPFSVLLDGRRTTVPAVHVRGQMRFADRTITPEIWWLDDPGNPLTLKWTVGPSYEIVTRINRPLPGPGGTAQTGVGTGMMAGLASHACRAELTGVYFTTASAEVLDVSLPALKRFAALLAQHPDWHVTIEGHTDNIGSAEYNQDLSTRRAEAVRQALIGRFGVAAARLEAKGYGLTRPVESNATDQGRAHNRRVEVSRRCTA
jgi:outer membrane protein OmpA-like peptidoglycan-associated protein